MFAIAGIILAMAIGSAVAFQKYDPVNFVSTKGYDPNFLQYSKVKTTCVNSHTDLQKVGLPDLGYCDKKLGTL